jgi:MFS family permease
VVVQSYALFSTSLLLLGRAIGDRYERRRTYLFGIVIFTVASLAGALAVFFLLPKRSTDPRTQKETEAAPSLR